MMGASSYIRQRSSTSGELNRRGGPNRALVRPPTLLDADDLRGLRLAVRSREMLENGTHANIAEIAATEKINESCVGRVLRRTQLAVDIVETILDGRQPAEVTLAGLMRPFAVEWTEQRKMNFF